MSSGAPPNVKTGRSLSPDEVVLLENQNSSFKNNQMPLSNRQFNSLVMTSQEEDRGSNNGGGTSRRDQA